MNIKAHKIQYGNCRSVKIRAAYNFAQYVAERTEMMQPSQQIKVGSKSSVDK